ncbi:unnamed protein product [Candidula unifasciata]|uniref:Phospholipase B-like n=1 Tax=Candidula unifasciata TaxID=100452 RepID=A0A8S3Z6N6_9EUPU|nr:unnamed protein product [Candidula unifasciata]
MLKVFLLAACSLYVQAVAVRVKDSYQEGSVYCQGRSCKFVAGVLDWNRATAVGSFNETILSTGWGILDISAGQARLPDQTDVGIMFAAGYLEGALTARQMEYQFTNLANVLFPPKPSDILEKVKLWFTVQRRWADEMIQAHASDPIWRHASYILAQLDGLYAGYKSATSSDEQTTLDMFAINILNANGDLLDLISALSPESIPDWTKFSPQEAENYFYSGGHCSALIKLLPGYENIFMSHSSWFLYSVMNRIFKHYNLNVTDPATAARRISFSSYPGYLESLDDFYLLGSGLVMLQTTNSIYNSSLYKLVKPQSLMAWQRVRIANMMAHNGKEWTEIVSKYNSGTYNNQYMVVDTKLIQSQSPLPDNSLWVAEQIPGLVVAEDLTPILRAGYFPSYNIPFFEEIYNKSGYPEFVALHGKNYTYELAPRAKIFRRDQSSVKDMDTFKAIMRYNDYQNDPYSGGSPWNSICARGDLAINQTTPSGCYDTKTTDLNMARNFQADIINGPTTGTRLAPFSWTGKYASKSHAGLPETFNFSFVRTQPRF